MPRDRHDAGHFALLETVKVLEQSSGAAYASDSLMVSGVSVGSKTAHADFDSLEQFYASMESGENAITDFEGTAVHFGDGVFGLSACPFAAALCSYVAEHGSPQPFETVTTAMNKSSRLTRRLRVGEGSAVSPFCVMHQPLRSAMGERFSVKGRPLLVYQLGCRAAPAKARLAERWLRVTGVERALVESVLNRHACCFCFRLGDPELQV